MNITHQDSGRPLNCDRGLSCSVAYKAGIVKRRSWNFLFGPPLCIHSSGLFNYFAAGGKALVCFLLLPLRVLGIRIVVGSTWSALCCVAPH